MTSGRLARRALALAAATVGLIAVLSWFGLADFKIDVAIVCVAVLLGAYLLGKRRLDRSDRRP
jgi:hypothetical protein